MALPIVPGSEVSTPIGGTRLDSAAFREAALAPGRLAQALGQDVGGVFQDLSQKIQQTRNAQTIFRADLAMQKSKDDFTANLAKMPDEKTWLPAWKQQSDAVRNQIMALPNINPYTARMLNNKLDVWQAATTSEINYQALRKGANQAKQDAVADATYTAHGGNLQGATDRLNAAVAHNIISDDEAKEIGRHFPEIAQSAQVTTGIETSPQAVLADLKERDGKGNFTKFTALNPNTRLVLTKRADTAVNQDQLDTYREVAQNQDAGRIYQRDELDRLVSAQKLKATAVDPILKRQAGLNKPASVPLFAANVQRAIDQIPDKLSDADLLKHELAITASPDYLSLPAPTRKTIDEQMALKKDRSNKEEATAQSDFLKRGAHAYNLGLFQNPSNQAVSVTKPGKFGIDWLGDLGLSHTEDVTEPQPNPATPNWQRPRQDENKNAVETAAQAAERVRQADLNYAKWRDQMGSFFKNNPKATSEEAETYSQALLAPLVNMHLRAALGLKTGIGYNSAEEVRAAYKAGDLSREEAAEVLKQQFNF